MPDRPQVRPGIKLPIRGVNHTVVHQPGRGVTATRQGNGGPELIVYCNAEHLPRRVADFLKKQAKAEIEPLVARHAGDNRQAGKIGALQGYGQPLGVLFVGGQSVLFLAHRHGAAYGDQLSRRP